MIGYGTGKNILKLLWILKEELQEKEIQMKIKNTNKHILVAGEFFHSWTGIS